MGRNDKGGRIATTYGVFDGRNRLDAVFAEISENSDKSGTQFAPDLGKFGPVHKRGLHVAQLPNSYSKFRFPRVRSYCSKGKQSVMLAQPSYLFPNMEGEAPPDHIGRAYSRERR